MSLFDELTEEDRSRGTKSRVEAFLETLDADERRDIHRWIAERGSIAALTRVLRRRGLDTSESTVRRWADKCR